MNKEFEERFDLRVEKALKDKFKKYCKSKKINLSDAGRDALETFIDSRMFIENLIESLQDHALYADIVRSFQALPENVRKPLERLLGPEEEKLVNKTPHPLLKNVKVMTTQGLRALKNYSSRN